MVYRWLGISIAGLAALAYASMAGAAATDVQSNHYLCYKVSVAKFPSQTIPKPVATSVSLADQFETNAYDVLKNTNICTPATVAGSTWNAASGQSTIHMTGYQIKITPPAKEPKSLKTGVHVFSDQFGMLSANVVAPAGLLVQSLKANYGPITKCKVDANCASQPTNTKCDPSAKICVPPTGIQPPAGSAPLPSTSGVNNFKCYKIKDLKTPPFTPLSQVTISDQFGSAKYDLAKITKICAPVNKASEGFANANGANDFHLVCYQAKLSKLTPAQPKFLTHKVYMKTANFGNVAFDVKGASEVCVPATKDGKPSGFTKLSFTTTVGSTSCGGPSFSGFTPPGPPFSGQVNDATNTKIGDLGLGCLYIGGGSAATPANQIPDASQSLFDLGTPSGNTVPLVASSGTGPQNCTKGAGPGKHCIGGSGGPIACTTDADCGGTPGSCALDANCYFGPPLPITGSLPVCVLNAIITDASGTATPSTGDSTVDIPLSSRVYLTANATDPCPRCINNVCDPTWTDGSNNHSPNAGQPCTPVGTLQTSLACGVPLGDFQGALPVTLSPLTTGPASKTDAAGFFCPSQLHAGAFHLPNGRTIIENGSPAGDLTDGNPHSSVLASVFCIPASNSVSINIVGDIPGPGAIGLTGKAQLLP
jgi:hypothetical protein